MIPNVILNVITQFATTMVEIVLMMVIIALRTALILSLGMGIVIRIAILRNAHMMEGIVMPFVMTIAL